jgi:hypothetical protein
MNPPGLAEAVRFSNESWVCPWGFAGPENANEVTVSGLGPQSSRNADGLLAGVTKATCEIRNLVRNSGLKVN